MKLELNEINNDKNNDDKTYFTSELSSLSNNDSYEPGFKMNQSKRLMNLMFDLDLTNQRCIFNY